METKKVKIEKLLTGENEKRLVNVILLENNNRVIEVVSKTNDANYKMHLSKETLILLTITLSALLESEGADLDDLFGELKDDGYVFNCITYGYDS